MRLLKFLRDLFKISPDNKIQEIDSYVIDCPKQLLNLPLFWEENIPNVSIGQVYKYRDVENSPLYTVINTEKDQSLGTIIYFVNNSSYSGKLKSEIILSKPIEQFLSMYELYEKT